MTGANNCWTKQEWLVGELTSAKLSTNFLELPLSVSGFADGLTYDEKARRGLAPSYYERMADKLATYRDTGNQEMLIDIQNYIWLEILQPTHPQAHFKSTERHG
jgi:hypothetical protein